VKPTAPAGGNGQSWATAFQKPEQAFAIAAAGDEVWLTTAQYVTPGAGGFVINTSIKVYGGFKGTETDHDHRLGSFLNTILDGDFQLDGSPTNNAAHVLSMTSIVAAGGNSSVLLDGFVIQNGYALASNATGAGIYAVQTDLDLANLYVRDNFAPAMSNNNFGGGLYFTSSAPAPAARLRIKNCEFRHNTGSRGGAMYVDRAKGEIVNTQFLLNQGFPYAAGAYLTRMVPGDRLDFTNCVFWQNTCTMLGALPEPGAALYLADVGAGTGGTTKIVNCTFSDNSGPAGYDGQAMVISPNSQATIYNSILFFNGSGGSGSPAPIFGAALVGYSDV
jgi:hypothetical protein